MTRNVADLVKKDHFVLDSEYLVTMLVVVPLSNINDWNNKYEKLTDMIVPRSSQLIYQVCSADHFLLLFCKMIFSRTMIMLWCPSLVSRKLQMSLNKEQEKTDL